MTPSQLAALEALAGRALTQPEQTQIDAHIATGDMQPIADIVSAGRTAVQPLMLSERGVMERYPGGPVAADAVLVKLETFAASGIPGSGPVKRALKFLGQAEGLDIGSAATQAQLTALGAAGVITVAEADALKALAVVPAPVSWQQCHAALQE